MYKIGVIGHSIEYISDCDRFKREINSVVDLIKFQYGENLVLNIGGNIGVGHWVAKTCIDFSIKYHLFMPGPIEETSKHWYENQQKDMIKYFNRAWASTICSPKYDSVNCYKLLADSSNFIMVFRADKRREEVYDCIKHCLDTNKMVINGSSLKMITHTDLE